MLTLSGYLLKSSAAIALVSLTLTYSQTGYAELTQQVKDVRLNNVTVFLRGAELFNSAQVSLPAGESEVIFTNIASDINEKTVLIGTDSKALIKSSVVRRNYLEDKVNQPGLKALESQIEELHDNWYQLQIEQQVVDAQLKLLQENSKLTGDTGFANVDDISDMWDFIGTEMRAALKDKVRITKSLTEVEKKRNSLQQQVKELQTEDAAPGNQLVVKFYSEEPVNANVHLSYAIRNANWVPAYDVSVNEVNGPVNFTYKASVAQGSGIDWGNVRLKLSTGNLSQSAQAPVIRPNYLSVDESTGVYYELAARAPREQNEIAVMDSKASYSKTLAKEKTNTINDYVVTDVNGINTTFDITLPYSIPSDSKQHLVAIKEEQAMGDYRYYVVPKLDDNAFLQLQVADWQRLNLLPGKSNVFFEGSFVGEGYINTNNIQDNVMNISLGRDKKIIVNRSNLSEMRGKPEFFGNNINQSYGYVTNIQNTRNDTIKLAVVDQVPVSRDARITVTDVKYDKSAQWNKDTGEIVWNLTMAANASEKLSLAYTVKYPKDKEVLGL